MALYVVCRSALIETLDEARDYYAERIAGARSLTVSRSSGPIRVTIVFERDATHLYSESISPGESIPPDDLVTRSIPAGRGKTRVEQRRFSLVRAVLLDEVLRAISRFTVAVPEAGGRVGHQKSVVYGPALPSGERMRVVLRPGPGDARTCVSAYPVTAREFAAACRLKRARFP